MVTFQTCKHIVRVIEWCDKRAWWDTRDLLRTISLLLLLQLPLLLLLLMLFLLRVIASAAEAMQCYFFNLHFPHPTSTSAMTTTLWLRGELYKQTQTSRWKLEG